MWLLDQLYPGSFTYNIGSAIRLSGCPNTATLEPSLDEIAKCHEVLRTTIAEIDGSLIPVIATTVHIDVQVLDLQHLSPVDTKAQINLLAAEQAKTHFDLVRGPLLRAVLLRLQEREHMSLWSIT